MYSSRILFYYILKEQVKIFVLAVACITLVMNFGALLVYMQQYPLPLGSLMKVLPYHTPVLFPWILPLSVLMAVTLTYGRLASDNEIIAIQLAGVHLMRPVMPAVVMGVLVMTGLFFINDQLLPWCRVREYEVYKEESEVILVRVFETQSKLKGGDYTVSWDAFEDRTLRHITVRQRDKEDVVAEYTAGSATYAVVDSAQGPMIRLALKDITGTQFREGIEIKWDSHTQEIPLKGVFQRPPDYKAMSTREMMAELREIDRKYGPSATPKPGEYEALMAQKRVRDIWMRIHRMYSLSASALALALVGVPLGILARQAHMLSAFFLGCLPVMLVYYPVFLLGQSMADEGAISASAACWTPTGLLTAVGVGLLAWLFTR